MTPEAHQTRQKPVSADRNPPRASSHPGNGTGSRGGRPPVPVGTRHNGRVKRPDGRWMTDRQWKAEQTAKRAARAHTDRIGTPITADDRALLNALSRDTGMSPPELAAVALREWLEPFK